MERPEGTKTSDDYWSWKCNTIGRRFMVLQDGHRRIRWFEGGYTPKLYDGAFLETQKHFLSDHLAGAIIVADMHFELGNKIFDQIKFHVAVRKKAPGRPKKGEVAPKIIPPLTKKQKQYNKLVQHLRARVESPFGWIKRTFKVLEIPFRESAENLNNTVIFAFGVHNCKIDK